MHHVYGTPLAPGSRWSQWSQRVITLCLLATAVVSCGADDTAGQDATEPPSAEPSPAGASRTQPSPVPTTTAPAQPEPTTTEPGTPTEGTGMSQAPEPAPPVLTDVDDGRSFGLDLGSEVSLQLDSAWIWDEPAVQGDAVVLTRVDYLTDPGFMEWIVTAQRAGDAVVTANGEPNCDDPSQCPSRVIELRFRVSD